jgi:hypothetical protein
MTKTQTKVSVTKGKFVYKAPINVEQAATSAAAAGFVAGFVLTAVLVLFVKWVANNWLTNKFIISTKNDGVLGTHNVDPIYDGNGNQIAPNG